MKDSKTFLCISNYFKGNDFLIALKELGNKVFLITSDKLQNEAWAFDSIDEVFYMPGQDTDWNLEHLFLGVCGILKHTKIDVIIALDDFDVEKATYLRENLRIPGMGQTTGRYFRDKLAMRMKAKENGIPVPAFSALFNDEEINSFADENVAPWVLKPRSEASANGIMKVHSKEELWQKIHELGDNRFHYLVEQFKPGAVYHADGLIHHGEVVFCNASQYLNTPMEVSQGGGIFRSATLPYNSNEFKSILSLNDEIMEAFGIQFGASHTEFIKCNEDGQFYFLETSSRVGGAHLAELVECATNINLWKEWAKIEDANAKKSKYKLPKSKKEYAGIINTLSKYQHSDLSSYNAPEVCWNIPSEYHAGLILKSKSHTKILDLLEEYANRFLEDFSTTIQQKKPIHLH